MVPGFAVCTVLGHFGMGGVELGSYPVKTACKAVFLALERGFIRADVLMAFYSVCRIGVAGLVLCAVYMYSFFARFSPKSGHRGGRCVGGVRGAYISGLAGAFVAPSPLYLAEHFGAIVVDVGRRMWNCLGGPNADVGRQRKIALLVDIKNPGHKPGAFHIYTTRRKLRVPPGKESRLLFSRGPLQNGYFGSYEKTPGINPGFFMYI